MQGHLPVMPGQGWGMNGRHFSMHGHPHGMCGHLGHAGPGQAGRYTVGGRRPSASAQETPVAALRPAGAGDLDAVNRVIERALGTWALPERVRRLSLPLYRYSAVDLQHLTVWVAQQSGETVGIAAWEPADPADAPEGRSGLFLHGLYVDPAHHGQGIGRSLLEAALSACRADGLDGVLVKAQAQAVGFFDACGLVRLPVANPGRDYVHRFWAAVRSLLASDLPHERATSDTRGSGRRAGRERRPGGDPQLSTT